MLNFIKNFLKFTPNITLTDEDIEAKAASTYGRYWLNDLTDPIHIDAVNPKQPEKLQFATFKGGSEEEKLQAKNCHFVLACTINHMQGVISKYKNLQKWAAVPKLGIYPRAGEQLNAYYDRKSLKFFSAVNPIKKKRVYTADSTDIVAHELGHAILDAMRPDFWSINALEIWSFHESFADISALVFMMLHPQVLERACEETDGKLDKSNIITKLAEEVGIFVSDATEGKSGTSDGLRNAINDFVYIHPEKLPKEAPRTKLAAECHSFGRILLGAWYDIFVEIYKREVEKGKDQLKAATHARDVAFDYLIYASVHAPRTVRFTDAAAKTMLVADKINGSPYQDILKNIFKKRKLLKPQVKMLSAKSPGDLPDGASVTSFADGYIYKYESNVTMKLSDYIDKNEVQSLSFGGYNLADVEIEIPTDNYYEFNNDGVLVDEIVTNHDEVLQDVRTCISMLQANVGGSDDTMWEVTGGRLVRTYIE